MAYSKTTWVDRLVENPNRYTKSDESSEEVTLTASPGTVTAEGTPISATNMNKIEQGIADVDAGLVAHKADYVNHVPYGGTTTGSANAHVATLSPALTVYVAGVALSVKLGYTNTGASTINVNGLGAKSILDSKGNALTAGKLTKDSVVTLRYNGTAFILQGEGGEYGTATASDVLAGKTIGTSAGILTGTMVDNGPSASETINLTNHNQEYTIATGYHHGLRKIKTVITNLTTQNIKNGISVGGVVGTGPKYSVGEKLTAPQVGYTAPPITTQWRKSDNTVATQSSACFDYDGKFMYIASENSLYKINSDTGSQLATIKPITSTYYRPRIIGMTPTHLLYYFPENSGLTGNSTRIIYSLNRNTMSSISTIGTPYSATLHFGSIGPDGALYTFYANGVIVKSTFATNSFSLVYTSESSLGGPPVYKVLFSGDYMYLLVQVSGSNFNLHRIRMSDGVSVNSYNIGAYVSDFTISPDGFIYIAYGSSSVIRKISLDLATIYWTTSPIVSGQLRIAASNTHVFGMSNSRNSVIVSGAGALVGVYNYEFDPDLAALVEIEGDRMVTVLNHTPSNLNRPMFAKFQMFLTLT